MGFGDSIAQLLEVYGNCLKLLEVFRRQTGEAPDSDAASLLQKSIRSDRSKVRRRYASRLSENGKRLERGDGQARSVLRRTLKKLNAAIVGLLHMGRTESAVLDYDALKRLSNSSRIEAVNAIDQLSQRLGSSPPRQPQASSHTSAQSPSSVSRRSVSSGTDVSPSTPHPAKTRKDSTKKSLRKLSRAEAATSPRKAPSPKEPKRDGKKLSASSPGKNGAIKHDSRDSGRSSGGSSSSNHHSSSGANTSDGADGDGADGGSSRFPRRPVSPNRSSKQAGGSAGLPNRLSMMTIATVSTKLGEIPERRRLQRQQSAYTGSTSAEDSSYNVVPTYPLKPYREPPERRSKGGFWGFLRR